MRLTEGLKTHNADDRIGEAMTRLMAPSPEAEYVWAYPDGTEITCDRSNVESCAESPYSVHPDIPINHGVVGAMCLDGFFSPLSRPITPDCLSKEATVPEERGNTMKLWHEWEQVLFANVSDEVAQDNLNECVHELLDKAATVGAGTCHNISKVTDTRGRKVRFVCSECDAWIDSEFIWNHEYSNGESPWVKDCKLNYCPNCGRKVIGTKEEAE